MALDPASLAGRVAKYPKLHVVRIGRFLSFFPALLRDCLDPLDCLCDLLGKSLTLKFVVRAQTPDDLTCRFLHASEAALFKIPISTGPTGAPEPHEQAPQYQENIHRPTSRLSEI